MWWHRTSCVVSSVCICTGQDRAVPSAPSYGARACALLAVAMGQGVWPQRGEPNPTVLKYSPLTNGAYGPFSVVYTK